MLSTRMLACRVFLVLALVLNELAPQSSAFTPVVPNNHRAAWTVMNGKVNLKEALSGGGSSGGSKKDRTPKGERKFLKKRTGQRAVIPPAFTDVSGVSLPPPGKVKAWELTLSEEIGPRKFACCRPTESQVYLVDGQCTRCAFDLWKGECIPGDADGANGIPRVVCPTCAQMFSLQTGDRLGVREKDGLTGFVNGLARSATATNNVEPVGTYPIRVVRTTAAGPESNAEDGSVPSDLKTSEASSSSSSGSGVRIQADFTEIARKAQKYL